MRISVAWESQGLDIEADDERSSRLFQVARGSWAGPLSLPWLDVELAFLIAVNRRPGDDVGIALGYRGETGEPAVVASDVWANPGGPYIWRPVAPSFDLFANMLGCRPISIVGRAWERAGSAVAPPPFCGGKTAQRQQLRLRRCGYRWTS